MLRFGLEVLLQAGSEIEHADHRVDDGQDDEDDGQDGKRSQRLLHRLVEVLVRLVIDSRQLEDEVGESSEIQDDDGDHAPFPFLANEHCRRQQDGDGNGYRCRGQTKFGIRLASDDDEELNRESKEEEEIELQKCDVNL